MRSVLFLCVFVISAEIITAQFRASLDSSPDTALEFSKCVVDKLCKSQMFTLDDQESMTGVAGVMSQGVKNMGAGRRSVSVKILLTSFLTSVADIILLGDVSKNLPRKNFYTATLEQCSSEIIRAIDTETIRESLRIINSLEKSIVDSQHEEFAPSGLSEAEIFAPEKNPQAPDIYGTFAVGPSPVQNPFMPTNFDPNSKTVFRPPEDPLNFSPFSVPAQLSANVRFPGRLDSNIHVPPFAAPSILPQAGLDSISRVSKTKPPQSEMDYFEDSYVAPSFEFGVLNVPQTKSSAVANPPMPPQTGIRMPFRDQSIPRESSIAQYPRQPARNIDFPAGPGASSVIRGSGTAFTGPLGNADPLSLIRTSQNATSQFGGLNIPQMKESSIRVIPPTTTPYIIENVPSQDQTHPVNVHQYPTAEIPSPQKVNSFTMTSPASLAQTDKQNQNFQFDPKLENIVFNILMNSPNFRDFFSYGINPQNAVNFARSITEKSLAGYNSEIISDALDAVSNSVARVGIGSPDNYALALSDALVHVLKMHNLPLFVDGSEMATKILSNLDTIMQIPVEYIGEEPGEDISSGDYYRTREGIQLPFDYQSETTTPEDSYREKFIKDLTHYIFQSDELANLFCNRDISPNRLKTYFSIIKSSLSEYGSHVASMGASIASSNLLDLSHEALCSSYAQTISEAIVDILDDNRLLADANSESIANKISHSVSQQLDISTPNPEITADDVSERDTTNMPRKITPVLQSSFASNFDKPNEDTSVLPDIYNQPSTNSITSSVENNYRTADESPDERPNVEPVSPLFTISPSPILLSSSEAAEQKSETQNEYTIPFTVDVADDELTSATTFMYSLTTSPVTEHPLNDKEPVISDDIIDEKQLASFLHKEMQSIVDAIQDKTGDEETDSSGETETEAKVISVNDNSQTDSKPSTNDNTNPEHLVKTRSSRRKLESGELVKGKATSKEDPYAKTFNTQSHSQLNQQNFQNTQLSDITPASDKKLSEVSNTSLRDPGFRDSLYILVKAVSDIASNSIAFIKSQDFNLLGLCEEVNILAPILRIPPLDVCEETAVIDYLLHVLLLVTDKLKGF